MAGGWPRDSRAQFSEHRSGDPRRYLPLDNSLWIVPGLQQATNPIDLVYDSHQVDGKPGPNAATIEALANKLNIVFHPRDKTNIMHDKFLVRIGADERAEAALCGSANFTSEGLPSQANLLHTFDSQALAALFRDRQQLIRSNPSVPNTAHGADWSDEVQVGAAHTRVFFSPEPPADRQSVSTVVQSIQGANSSVLFCLFDPTDMEFLNAAFQIGDAGKMMFGLVNHIQQIDPHQPSGSKTPPANVVLYHRSRDNKDVVDAESFAHGAPPGFLPELSTFPGDDNRRFAPILIHHKFILIDGETDKPTIYSGSANISNNSTHRNDEALLEIKGSQALAQLYMAEFFRLYENYRARAKFRHPAGGHLTVSKDVTWARKYFTQSSPEQRARLAMAH